MKKLFIFTYPKLTLYAIAIVAAYLFFSIEHIANFVSSIDNLIYLAIFIAGLLYSAGFTTPIATGFFLTLDTSDPYLAALSAGLGALIADIGIFSFIRFSFMDEFHKLEHTSFIHHIVQGTKSIVPQKLRTFLVYVLACLIVASPLPDEVAVTLLAGFTKVHHYAFMVISYMGNVLGIYLLITLF